jgi:hypothetical protein
MPAATLSPPLAQNMVPSASVTGNSTPNNVVEINLLLPKEWADALVELSNTRRESVGQILRSIIRHALIDSDAHV